MPKRPRAGPTRSSDSGFRSSATTHQCLGKPYFPQFGVSSERPGLAGEPSRPIGRRLPGAGRRPERFVTFHMIESRADHLPLAITLGADKVYDTEDFVNELRGIEGDAARGADHKRSKLGDRRTHDAAPRLCRQPAYPQAH